MTQIFPLQNLQVVHHLLIKTGRSAQWFTSDSSDPPLYFRCSTPTWGLLYVTPIVRIRRWSSCWQLYRWFMKAAAKTGRVQNKPMIYSRESELRNWCFKKKSIILWLTFEFLPVRFKEFKGMVGSSAVNKQRTNTIKMRDSFTEGTGRGAWCPRLQKHYDRKWHFLLSSSYLHVWVWQTGCVNYVCSFVPFTK